MSWLRNTPSSQPALYDVREQRWYSYGELLAEVERLSPGGAGGKQLVMCFGANSLPTLAAWLFCLEKGHCAALLAGTMDAATKQRLLDLYKPEFVVDESAEAPGAQSFVLEGAGYTRICPNWWQSSGPVLKLGEDLQLLLPTSGSTGSPKLVRLSRRNVESNAQSIAESLAITPADRAVTSLPLYYSFGLSVVNSHLSVGASFVLTGAALLEADFWKVFRAQRCTSIAGVPYTYETLHRLDLDRLDIPTLNTMIQAGGKLRNDLISSFQSKMKERGGRFFVMYGQTEATARMCILPSEKLPEKLGSVGVPVPGGSLRIVADAPGGTERECRSGEVGEIVYCGQNVMQGYAECRGDLCLGDTMSGVLRTGDLGYLDDDNFLFVTGRVNRFAKIFGQRINLHDVESWFPSQRCVAVSDDNKLFVLFGGIVDTALTKQLIAERLNIHRSAVDVRCEQEFPVTANGKVDYMRIRELVK